MFGHTMNTPAHKTDQGGIIFDATTQDFEQRVIAASMEKPVIVDFWAPWCGPCKQLMPLLENAVNAAGGAVLMAKVDLDSNPQLAQALQVQSVPTVYAFFQGRPVDAFSGLQPESQIKAFVQKLITLANNAQPDAIDIPEALSGAAQALGEGDAATAQAIYAQILQQDEQNAEAYVGIIRTFIAVNQIEQAQQMVDTAPDAIAKSSLMTHVKSAIELASNAGHDIAPLRAKIAADADDHQSYIDLAQALFAQGQQEEALSVLLDSIARDLEWNEQAARQELLKMFQALGLSDPLTLKARRKLSSLLFS